MEVHDEFLPGPLYARILANVPEVCVEVVLERDGAVLLARRTNEPAEGEWFWPGSRLYKGEETTTAAHRVAREELGIEISLQELLGVYSHFWEHSALPGDPSRHTVNVVYRAVPAADDPEVSLDDQHDAYRWVETPEPELHEYVGRYFEDAGLPRSDPTDVDGS